VAVADSWKNSNLLIASKRRISDYSYAPPMSSGCTVRPTVSGPLQSLVLAMTGRKESHQISRVKGSPHSLVAPESVCFCWNACRRSTTLNTSAFPLAITLKCHDLR